MHCRIGQEKVPVWNHEELLLVRVKSAEIAGPVIRLSQTPSCVSLHRKICKSRNETMGMHCGDCLNYFAESIFPREHTCCLCTTLQYFWCSEDKERNGIAFWSSFTMKMEQMPNSNTISTQRDAEECRLMRTGAIGSQRRACRDMDYELHFSFEIHAETVQWEYAAAQ